MAEGNAGVADLAKRRRAAGARGQIMCTGKSWETEKSYRLLA